ncbi:hypothetical protein PJ985_12150 [Streptomyces sp. ACA25]|uniref:VMAP-C domain-containing protein n=1 Tax=Streptomyces sp. ACA25 TaxID=3022596 RepID=UPI002307E6E0|nr:hypothetical protein [Streptomyces sp. ACA25]MDB1088317.1 hypothetical protein [Streptomyces sp. ACA25]
MSELPAADDAELPVRLVDALMKVSVLDDLENRRLCTSLAMDRLGVRLSVPERSEKRVHVVAMVRAFGTVDTGLRELTGAVHHLAGYDLPSQHALGLVDPVLPPVLDEPGRRELAGLLAGLDRGTVPELPALYHAVAGDSFGPLPGGVHTAWDAHELLAHTNRPAAAGASRSMRFLQELAAVQRPELGDRIRSWVSRQVRDSAGDSTAAQRVLDDARRNTGSWRDAARSPAHLLIRLYPSTSAAERVHVTCWTNTGEEWAPRRRDDRTVPRAEVRQHVAALVDREEIRLREHRGEVVLEFILPASLMNEPVENWPRAGAFPAGRPWGSDDGGPPLWQDYAVVVRSLERIEALQLHRVWNERWDVLRSGVGSARAHHCAQGDGARRNQLYARLKENADVVLMALGSPPDDEHGRNELFTGLQAGLPLFVWSHRGSLAAPARSVVEALLEARLSELPERLRPLRSPPGTRDYESGDSTSSRIAVLWDDPDRLPEIPAPVT